MTSDREYLRKAQSAALAESNKRRPEKNAALAEGIDAFKSNRSWEKCPYRHTKPPSQAFDVKYPNAPFEIEAGTKVSGTIMFVQPPLEYEKAKAWKRGWLIAYWHEILEVRKNSIKKVNRSIRHTESLAQEYASLNKLVEEGLFKHFFNHFQNVENLKLFESKFYQSREYKFLESLHLEPNLCRDGTLRIVDCFLILGRFEREMDIEPTDDYLFSYDVNPEVKEVHELQQYEETERYEEKWKLEASDLFIVRDNRR